MKKEIIHCDCPDCCCGDKDCPGKEALEEMENSQNKATKQKSKGYKMIKKGLNKLKDIKP